MNSLKIELLAIQLSSSAALKKRKNDNIRCASAYSFSSGFTLAKSGSAYFLIQLIHKYSWY